jgi:predicted ArsR family transcriptional regulator
MDLPIGAPDTDPAVRAIATLGDGLRQRMYAFIRDAGEPVTREQVAAATGISRKLAAFHLDKLLEVRLIHADDAPIGVRRVGRRPKLYRCGDLDVQVSIPARQHDTLAEILLEAVLTSARGEDAAAASLRIARARGGALGAAARSEARPGRLGVERCLSATEAALRHWGFEPYRSSPACLRLRNCPFQPLASRAPALICGINHAFLAGFLDGLDTAAVHAVLDPHDGECCVELRATTEQVTPRAAPPPRRAGSGRPTR